MREIYWSDESQNFFTIPDGDRPTPREVKEYYEEMVRLAVQEIGKPANRKTEMED